MLKEQIAKVAHEVNKAYCEAQGDTSQLSWEEAPEWQRESCISGVQYHLDNPNALPEDSHNSWLSYKEKYGWVYGEIKDVEKKTHPCMMEYYRLPLAQRVKDYLFKAVVDSLKNI